MKDKAFKVIAVRDRPNGRLVTFDNGVTALLRDNYTWRYVEEDTGIVADISSELSLRMSAAFNRWVASL